MKNNSGITLIALIITIIVMLILAAVTINMVVNGGLFDQAKNAVEETKNKVADEQAEVIAVTARLDRISNPDKSFETIVKDAIEGTTFEFIEIDGEGNAIIRDKETGREYTIEDETYKVSHNGLESKATDPRTNYGVIEIAWLDKDNNVIANPAVPNLATGMEKVAWEGTGASAVEKTGNDVSSWYNYNASEWANAKKTDDGSYFVWIPRYSYKIIYFDTQANKDAYIANNSSTKGIKGYSTIEGIVNKSDNKVVENTQTGIGERVKTAGYTDYIPHPAFLGTGAADLGGGFGDSKGIDGIWVAKYEMSMENASGTNVETYNESKGNIALSSSAKMVSKPGIMSWRNINIANTYENSKAYDTNKKSHLMKNSEWGAVAYLTHSKYGRNGVKVALNNTLSYYTGGASGATSYKANMDQSSTGNVYGIYDLNGGAGEVVAAYCPQYSMETAFGGPNGNSNASYSPVSGKVHFAYILKNQGNKSDEYVTAYTNDTEEDYRTPYVDKVSKTGDGIKEMWVSEEISWFGEQSYVVSLKYPFFYRSGGADFGSSSGIFFSRYGVGPASKYTSFRVVLVP